MLRFGWSAPPKVVRKRAAFASGRAAAFAMVLLTGRVPALRSARAQCATRLGNIALEERSSRSEGGCGELRGPATALGPGSASPSAPVLGLSATTPFAPSPFRSVHAHGLAEKAGELWSVFWIVGLLVVLHLTGEFGDWRYQLTDHSGKS